MSPNITDTQKTTKLRTTLNFQVVRPNGVPEDYVGGERHIYLFQETVEVSGQHSGVQVKVDHCYAVLLAPGIRRWRADHIENSKLGAAGTVAIYGPDRESYFDTAFEAAKAVATFKAAREAKADTHNSREAKAA